MSTQSQQQLFDFPQEEAELRRAADIAKAIRRELFKEEAELRRVGGRIGELVLEFAKKYQGIEFHAEELWKWVSWEKPVAPDSPRRILSLLAKRGYLTYVVTDRAKSLYKIVEVRR